MQRSGAAESDKCEVPRIVALLDRNKTQCAKHRFVHDFDNAFSGRHQINVHRVGQCLHSTDGRVSINGHRAAQLDVRRQITQYNISVTNCRPLTAFHIRSRSGIRACGVRSDAQRFREFRTKRD